jgi:hypothetical protein
MSQETRRILEMVAAGQLSPEDADKLADKLLEKLRSSNTKSSAPSPAPPANGEASAGQRGIRFLRVVVDQPGRDQVNIRVPLGILRTGMKLLGILPLQVSEKLTEKGIDLSVLRELGNGELVDHLKDLNVDVDSKNGEKVRIYCE